MLIPAVALLLSPSLPLSLKGILGRITWCMGSIGMEDTRLVQIDDRAELAMVVEGDEGDDQDWLMLNAEDEKADWVPLKDEGFVSRLGKVPFGTTYLKQGPRWERIKANVPTAGLQTDGGIQLLNSDRGSYTEFLPSLNLHDQVLIYVDKAEERIRNAAGTNQANQAEEQALKEHGGSSRLSGVLLGLMAVMSLVFGAVMGFLVVGL